VEDYGADLLVLGAQQSRFRGESVIGTTTERLVRLARFPMLTVVRQPAERLEHEDAEALALATV
ncbi:MAG: universal stress protein, partial [Thermoanaerobaculia bacterium]